MSSPIQLNFSLRTSSNCKSVHLIGSWDKYSNQLPLSKDSTKAGGWKGTFRFQGATLKRGQRYWYYYIIDGYHVSHDPAREAVVEPTTGRKLNVLDIPAPTAASTTAAAPAAKTAAYHKRRTSQDVPKGRSLSPSLIACPKPQRQHLLARGQYETKAVEALAAQLAAAKVAEESSEDESDSSDDDSDVPSLTSRSSNSSSPSSVSSTSSCCTCERYGITRTGHRVKLDCGGSLCSQSSDSEGCSSESDDNEYRVRTTRRQGVVVRK